MGDYRNELQSALSQAEALRAENASLRMKLRAAGLSPHVDGRDGAGFDALPPEGAKALPRAGWWLRLGLFSALCAIIALLAVVLLARERAKEKAREERAAIASLPTAQEEPPRALPAPALPPVRVAPAPRDQPPITEVTDPWIAQPPVLIPPFHALGLRWPSDRRLGLYVLHTTPAASCSVGGVIVDAPSVAFVTEGTHRVRCQVGRMRHIWDVRIEGRRVTFDTLHNVGSP